MKVLVAVKRVIDYQVKVRVKADRTGVETAQVKMSMNPFDEIAIEEALRLQEQGIVTEIIAVSIGSNSVQETLRQALALGVNRAIQVEHDAVLEPINVAKLLQALVKQEQVSLVLLGKQAIDDDCNQTGQMLAALLDWPQATFVSKLKVTGDSCQATREVDGGLQTLAMKLPAVITTDLRLNEPRYASLPNIMKAKSKPLAVTTAAELGVKLRDHQTMMEVSPPSERSAGVKVENIKELLDLLKNKDKVLP